MREKEKWKWSENNMKRRGGINKNTVKRTNRNNANKNESLKTLEKQDVLTCSKFIGWSKLFFFSPEIFAHNGDRRSSEVERLHLMKSYRTLSTEGRLIKLVKMCFSPVQHS